MSTKKNYWVDAVFLHNGDAEDWLTRAKKDPWFPGAKVFTRTLSVAGTSVAVYACCHVLGERS